MGKLELVQSLCQMFMIVDCVSERTLKKSCMAKLDCLKVCFFVFINHVH